MESQSYNEIRKRAQDALRKLIEMRLDYLVRTDHKVSVDMLMGIIAADMEEEEIRNHNLQIYERDRDIYKTDFYKAVETFVSQKFYLDREKNLLMKPYVDVGSAGANLPTIAENDASTGLKGLGELKN
jgi:hypothetical protein